MASCTPVILVYECMKLLVSRLSKEFKRHFNLLSNDDKVHWLQLVQKHGSNKIPGEQSRSKKTEFVRDMGVLSQALEFPESRLVAATILPVYKATIHSYSEQLEKENREMVRQLLAPESHEELMKVMREWAALEGARVKRNQAGHVASRFKENDPQQELLRLKNVRDAFGWYMETRNEHLLRFEKISRVAMLELGKSINELGMEVEQKRLTSPAPD